MGALCRRRRPVRGRAAALQGRATAARVDERRGESAGEGEGCGEPASVSFISPGAAAENPIWLAVAAEGAVATVRYSAEGVQALGESDDPESDFGVSVTLGRSDHAACTRSLTTRAARP